MEKEDGDNMKRVTLFRMLILFISISLIFDFFFIAVEITEGKVVSGLTLFDRAIIDKIPLDDYVLGIHSDHNYSIIIYFLGLVPPILILVLLYFSRTNNRLNIKESNLIFPASILGLLVYLVLVALHSRYMGETSAIFCITKGFLGAYIGIAKYIGLIYLTFQIRMRYRKNDNEVNINISSLLFLSILTELICMFFYTPICSRISIERFDTMSGYAKCDYSKFMYSPFYMMFKYKNYGGYNGKEGFYPFMIIMLLCYIGSFVLEFFKNKRNNIITICLLSVSMIVLIIGCVSCTNSFMAHYMTAKKTNFLNCISVGFYMFIVLTGALIFIRIMQMLNMIDKTQIIVNADEYVSAHEKEIEEKDNDLIL